MKPSSHHAFQRKKHHASFRDFSYSCCLGFMIDGPIKIHLPPIKTDKPAISPIKQICIQHKKLKACPFRNGKWEWKLQAITPIQQEFIYKKLKYMIQYNMIHY